MTIITFIFVLVCCGVGAFLVKRAPFLDEPYKTAILWVILAVAVFCFLWMVWNYLPLLHLPAGRK